MKKASRDLISWLLELLNVGVLGLPLFYLMNYFYLPASAGFSFREYIYLIIIFYVLYMAFGHVYEGFEVSVGKIADMVYSQVLAVFITDGIMYVAFCIARLTILEIWPLMVVFVAQIYLATVWAFIACRFYFALYLPHKTLVVYDQRRKVEELITNYGFDRKYDVQAVVSANYFLKHYRDEYPDVDTIFLSGVSSQNKNEIIKYCLINHVTVMLIPYIGDVIMKGAETEHMFHLPVLKMSRFKSGPMYIFCKRAIDVIASGLMLLILSPIMIITAIAIKKDGGPAFYKQVRLTKDNKEFEIYKFRSMRIDAEKDGVARLSTGSSDDRITPVGRIIRKYRIDELPQLINILKGDMTIVGPRPERPQIAEDYKKTLPEFDLRLQVKAGLTGYAQVYGKYNTTPYDKLQMDLMYISSCNLLEDLKIIFATIKILFEPESTEGVAVGQTTAMAEVDEATDSSED